MNTAVTQWQVARPGRLSVDFEALFVNGLILIALAYTAAFNYIDDGLRTSIAGLVGLLLIGRCLLSWAYPAAQLATFLFAAFMIILLFHFIFLQDQVETALYVGMIVRLLTCLGAFMVLALARRCASPRLLIATSASILAIALIVAATGPGAVLGDIPRPATFTGGAEGVHATAYALTAAFLGTITVWRAGWLRTATCLLLALPLFVLIAMFQVRTTWFMCVAYAGVAVIPYLPRQGTRGLWPAAACLAVSALLAFSVIERDVDFAEFSSGRTSAYTERIALLLNRPGPEMIIGTGPGSEVQTSSVWWWSAKNSHNDFIDIAIQAGFTGLAILVALLYLPSIRMDRVQLPLYVAFFASSLISNGLIGRPFLAMLFLAFVCVPRREQGPAEADSRMPLR